MNNLITPIRNGQDFQVINNLIPCEYFQVCEESNIDCVNPNYISICPKKEDLTLNINKKYLETK